MPRLRLNAHSLAGLLIALALVAVLFAHRSNQREEAQIHARYQQMRTALSSSDTNAVLALIAPNYRRNFHSHSFPYLDRFVQPLGTRSSIAISGNKADVCPDRIHHYLIIPGGNTVEMIKLNGDWFFTGDVHID